MLIPVGSGLFLLELFHVEAVLDRATQLAGLDHDVQYDAEGQRMQFLNHQPRIRKHRGVESKRAMTGVPARRAEAGAQVDQRITRELLLAECPRQTGSLHGSPACDGTAGRPATTTAASGGVPSVSRTPP